MDDVNVAWQFFVLSEYITLWFEYYLNRLITLMEEEEDENGGYQSE